jgi:hypothetical protein
MTGHEIAHAATLTLVWLRNVWAPWLAHKALELRHTAIAWHGTERTESPAGPTAAIVDAATQE